MPVDRWQWYRRRYRNRRWTLTISYSSVSTTIGVPIADDGWMNRWKKERPRKINLDQSFKQHHANILYTTDFLNTGRSVSMDTSTITYRTWRILWWGNMNGADHELYTHEYYDGDSQRMPPIWRRGYDMYCVADYLYAIKLDRRSGISWLFRYRGMDHE